MLELGALEKFYRQFAARTRIGMEATGNCQWFVDLLTSLGQEVQQQKHDKRDARRCWPRSGFRRSGFLRGNRKICGSC